MVPFTFFIGAATLAASATGLSVVFPTSGSSLDLSRATTVKWSSSSSDPSTFNLLLLNQNRVPSVNIEISGNLTTSDESYTFDSVDVLAGSGYIFNFKDVSTDNILAQSGEFTVVSAGSNTTNHSTTTVTTSSTAASSTGTPASTASSSTASSSTETPTGGATVCKAAAPAAGGAVAALLLLL
ncbi:hypothetical protein BJY01DRAFT_247337 [Aspergillus pseudoustus]|uniref:Yeast cell wall synthesis Kre9/Knh1-like N-terminal domain-containing protein n=1 Tax=Aspergillus pseudoustus TaxID=1810923 RepID=A0ABR4K1E8_9EURO